jgi:hypothetical protein
MIERESPNPRSLNLPMMPPNVPVVTANGKEITGLALQGANDQP